MARPYPMFFSWGNTSLGSPDEEICKALAGGGNVFVYRTERMDLSISTSNIPLLATILLSSEKKIVFSCNVLAFSPSCYREADTSQRMAKEPRIYCTLYAWTFLKSVDPVTWPWSRIGSSGVAVYESSYYPALLCTRASNVHDATLQLPYHGLGTDISG